MTTNTLNAASVLPLLSNVSGVSSGNNARRLAGAASIALGVASFALTYVGYTLGHCHGGLFSDVYRAAFLAIASIGTALPGLALGIAGACDRGNRMPAIIGAAISASFFIAFWMVWM